MAHRLTSQVASCKQRSMLVNKLHAFLRHASFKLQRLRARLYGQAMIDWNYETQLRQKTTFHGEVKVRSAEAAVSRSFSISIFRRSSLLLAFLFKASCAFFSSSLTLLTSPWLASLGICSLPRPCLLSKPVASWAMATFGTLARPKTKPSTEAMATVTRGEDVSCTGSIGMTALPAEWRPGWFIGPCGATNAAAVCTAAATRRQETARILKAAEASRKSHKTKLGPAPLEARHGCSNAVGK